MADSTRTHLALQEALSASWHYTDLVNEVLDLHRDDLTHLCGPHSVDVEQATVFDDRRLATDYRAAPRFHDLGVAVRVRSFSHLHRFGQEFVLRDTAPAGFPTEADKILTNSETASVYIYAFADATGTKFAQYAVIDLPRLRNIWASDEYFRSQASPVFFPDGKGLAFAVTDLMEAGCVIAADLAIWNFPRQREARATLETFDRYKLLPEDQRVGMEILLMQASYGTTQYRREGPLRQRLDKQPHVEWP